MEKAIVLTGACRTAIGKFGGSLANTPVAQLGAAVIKDAIKRAGIQENQVDCVIMGCVLQTGTGQNVARQAAIKAGLPVDVPAETVNSVCGSGLRSINIAASMILSGQADIVVAGGMENMSGAPYFLSKARYGYKMGNSELYDSMIYDGLRDAFGDYHMGITAENLSTKYDISRHRQDEYAVESQNKYQAAKSKDLFADEITPITINKDKQIFAIDEYPRSDVTYEKISGLKPVFLPDGTVTAANASGINDGAAAVVVMSADKAKELGIKSCARWIGGDWAGVEPSLMGLGPVNAITKLLSRISMNLNDFGLIEINEAFAVQVLSIVEELNIDLTRLNVNGGAIAIGHPIGASGCRILVSLLHEMRRRYTRYGLASLCIGGGMGIATAVENITL